MSEEDTEDQRKPQELDFLSALHYHRINLQTQSLAVLTIKHALNCVTYIKALEVGNFLLFSETNHRNCYFL